MKKIDLHCHTTASDGIKTPSGIIDFAMSQDVEVLAITDHDTVSGIEEALAHAASLNFRLIPGIEFSVEYPGGSFHLLGLNVDHTYGPMLEKLAHLQEVRDARIYRIINDLALHDIDIPVEEVLEESQGGTMGRPHVARVLVKHGYAPTINDVFKRFLVKGKPGYIKKEKIILEDALKLIRESGGQSIIAHPVSINYRGYGEFEDALRGFVNAGLDGIEVYSSMHSKSDVNEFLRLADKYGLIVSGGSDYHGDKGEKIGYYMPDRLIPAEICSSFIR